MASDDFNSMQAQLGLVGQGGSFNPLGIATPAPPPPPSVRHPGDVSQDIVRQTQTQMATTLQTTSAMRMGGMGGMAFGGGGGGGGVGGIGAVGAFAQQYQQNMMGINQQHIGAFSAQMMGQMSGMGGGFQPGMMPHPAMMTAPGMGIYRPFQPPQAPTVSPFPQMPMFQTPFTPMPPPPQFQTPMELSNNMSIQAGQRRTAAMFATPGVMARASTDVGLGYMGAGVGAAMGARFGPMGAAIGGTIGMAAGAFGSEHFGLGATAQHITARLNPFRTMAIRSQQMQSASQEWVGGGQDLNMMSGRGLSRQGATHLGRMLEDTAYSTKFRRETGGAFSAQDLTKITQTAGQQGLLQDSQSVDQIHEKVKGIAKSLVSFMKIANEPDVVEALKSMGRARQMGMSVGETMDMAVEARMFSKMAGTSVKGIMESGGAQGAMLFQQQGLSAGLGMRMGMGAVGMAGAAVSGGAFTPQRLAMLGGTQGVAQHEMESSAAFLKMPMMAAAMSRMGSGGEFVMDGKAVKSLGRGGMDISQMATRGVDNMLEAVRKQGVGALGMFQVQGTELQDNLGRLLGPQGVQAAKMQQVMQTMKLMGLDKNPGGFATAGLAMGMTNDQVKSMMSQANSPEYFNNLRKQLDVQKMELRSLGGAEFERNRPGIKESASRYFGGFRGLSDTYDSVRNIGEGISDFFGDDEELGQIRSKDQVRLKTPRSLLGTAASRRNMLAMSSKDAATAEAELARYTRTSNLNAISEGTRDVLDTVRGGDVENRRQIHTAAGGFESFFGTGIGSALETTYRAGAAALTGTSGGLNDEWENKAELKNIQKGSDLWAAGHAEGVEQRKDRIAAATKQTGGDEKKVRQLLANVEMRLGGKAREDKKFGRTSSMIGGDEAKDAIREEAKKLGLKVSDETVESMAIAGTEGIAFEAGQNVDATHPLGAVDVGADVRNKEILLNQQDSLTEDMFGSHGPLGDVGRGTRDRRAKLMQKMFGDQGGGRVGMLASILTAGGPEAAKARAEASPEEIAAAQKMVSGMTEQERADVKEMGERVNKTGLGTEEKLQGGEGLRNQELAIERKGTLQAGRKTQFGEGVDTNASTEQLLRGSSEGMSDRMKELKQKLKAAELSGADTSDIIAEAEDISLRSGVMVASQSAGGWRDPSEEAIKKERERIDETEKDVSGAFPQSVETFSEASHAMLRAAKLLGKSLDKNTMPVGGSMEPY